MKQAALITSHSQLLCSGTHNFTLFSLALIFTSTLLYQKSRPFINRQFSSDSFLVDHLVFISILQTTASDGNGVLMPSKNCQQKVDLQGVSKISKEMLKLEKNLLDMICSYMPWHHLFKISALYHALLNNFSSLGMKRACGVSNVMLSKCFSLKGIITAHFWNFSQM